MQPTTNAVRVYVSSPYSDMHSERRVLHEVVFPELRRRLEFAGLGLLVVDPCFGVTEEEAEGDGAPGRRLPLVMPGHPYFICLLGERYGKTRGPLPAELLQRFPPLKDCAGQSLLEWEIRLATYLLEPGAQRTFYYFRDPRFLRDIPPARRGDFWPEHEEAAARLGALKFRLRTSGRPVMDGYECRWDARKGEADGLDDFARQVTSDLWDAIAADHGIEEPAPSDDNVQFTVYRPKVVAPGKWYPMLAFAHLEELPGDADPDEPDPVAEVKRQAGAILGKQAANFKDSTQDASVAVPRQGEISFVPRCEGIAFSPTRRIFRWTESVHREEFRLMADHKLVGRTAKGSVAVFFGSILIAEITLSIQVKSGTPKAAPAQNQKTSARPYRKIFASYSHKDLHVVQEFEHYARTMGDAYIRDWVDLRAGENWNERLLGMIEEADVFQLFWSTHSLGSRYVEQEWRHALALGRPNFVRPVYWEDPMPAAPERNLPPDELSRLHFHRLTLHGLAPAPPPTHGKSTPAGDVEFEPSLDDDGGIDLGQDALDSGSSEFELTLDADSSSEDETGSEIVCLDEEEAVEPAAVRENRSASYDDEMDMDEPAPRASRSRAAPAARSEAGQWVIAALVSLLVVLGFFAILWSLRR